MRCLIVVLFLVVTVAHSQQSVMTFEGYPYPGIKEGAACVKPDKLNFVMLCRDKWLKMDNVGRDDFHDQVMYCEHRDLYCFTTGGRGCGCGGLSRRTAGCFLPTRIISAVPIIGMKSWSMPLIRVILI